VRILLRVLPLIALSLGAAGCDQSDGNDADDGPRSGDELRARVLDVIDGDTITVAVDGEAEDVRYIGIDTPEVDPSIGVECFGDQASDRNEELVGGERVRLVFDDELRDRYGRLLAYVHVGERFINAELVRGGFARTLTIEPNTNRAGLLDRLEQAAGIAGRGLWSACGP
jgi:micrococcal nuclease